MRRRGRARTAPSDGRGRGVGGEDGGRVRRRGKARARRPLTGAAVRCGGRVVTGWDGSVGRASDRRGVSGLLL